MIFVLTNISFLYFIWMQTFVFNEKYIRSIVSSSQFNHYIYDFQETFFLPSNSGTIFSLQSSMKHHKFIIFIRNKESGTSITLFLWSPDWLRRLFMIAQDFTVECLLKEERKKIKKQVQCIIDKAKSSFKYLFDWAHAITPI